MRHLKATTESQLGKKSPPQTSTEPGLKRVQIDALLLKINEGGFSNPKDLTFTWMVTDFTR